jgi:hypothetical protein
MCFKYFFLLFLQFGEREARASTNTRTPRQVGGASEDAEAVQSPLRRDQMSDSPSSPSTSTSDA